jgi:hypothetical protein
MTIEDARNKGSSHFTYNKKSKPSTTHITEKPYYYKDWSTLKTSTESQQNQQLCTANKVPTYGSTLVPQLEEVENLIASHYYKPEHYIPQKR